MSIWLLKLLPFLRWSGRVNRDSVRKDFIAGLTGAVIVLPQGVAFATIAGMPPQYGLYAGMVPAIIAALYGSSWHLVSGPTTAASIVLFSALSALAEPGTAEYVKLALTLTLMVGVIQFVMGMVRLGALVDFISHAVIIGFTAGAALLIAASQLKNFFGLDLTNGGRGYEIIYHALEHLRELNPFILAVSLITLAIGIAVRRFIPKVPYMIAAVIAGSLSAWLLNLLFGESSTGIEMVGALPATLPPLSSPDFSLESIKSLAPASFAMTLFALTEAVTIARSLAIRAGQRIDGDQEFIGQGLSNIVGSFFSSYVATGSFNRSGVNYDAGASTPLAAVFAGILLIIIVLLVAPLTAHLPTAVMAGLLMLVAWRLIDFHHIKKIIQTSRSETIVLLSTFGSTILFDLEFAILLGVTLSLFMYLLQTTRPRIYSRVPDPSLPKRDFTSSSKLPECPQLKVVRIDGSLFFGALHHVEKMFRVYERRSPLQNHLLIVASGINTIDISGAEFLLEEARQLRARGGDLYLYRVKNDVRKFLRRGGYLKELGEGNLFDSKTSAIAAIFKRLNMGICEYCDKRIFLECDAVEYKTKEENIVC